MEEPRASTFAGRLCRRCRPRCWAPRAPPVGPVRTPQRPSGRAREGAGRAGQGRLGAEHHQGVEGGDRRGHLGARREPPHPGGRAGPGPRRRRPGQAGHRGRRGRHRAAQRRGRHLEGGDQAPPCRPTWRRRATAPCRCSRPTTSSLRRAGSSTWSCAPRTTPTSPIASTAPSATSTTSGRRPRPPARRPRPRKEGRPERTGTVREAKAAKQKLSDKLQSTINSQIARSVELAATDRALAKQIAEEQAALVARLAAQQAAAEAAAARAAEEAAARQPTNQDPTGGETTPLAPVGAPTGGGTGTGGISLCTVGGITVNCAISGQLGNMLNAARADGLTLSGGGYRDPASQIALRRAHCGSSYYAIYQMSPSACSPPTARPGQSQHEIGLAIDFSNCSSRGSACYQWLAAHASAYGFYNLPSEPWHWSTTGS
ncbi:MAG: M15 family metallopeptidase [Acidimicrobiales bacterium]